MGAWLSASSLPKRSVSRGSSPQRRMRGFAQTVTIALRERLERVRSQHAAYDRRLQRLIDEYQELPEADTRSADEIIGYDEHGLPT